MKSIATGDISEGHLGPVISMDKGEPKLVK